MQFKKLYLQTSMHRNCMHFFIFTHIKRLNAHWFIFRQFTCSIKYELQQVTWKVLQVNRLYCAHFLAHKLRALTHFKTHLSRLCFYMKCIFLHIPVSSMVSQKVTWRVVKFKGYIVIRNFWDWFCASSAKPSCTQPCTESCSLTPCIQFHLSTHIWDYTARVA